MSTFIERCMRIGNWETDPPYMHVDIESLRTCLQLWEADSGTVTIDYIKNNPMISCTPEQGADLDEIIATCPTAVPSPVAAVARSRWIQWVIGVLIAGLLQWDGFQTENEVRAAIGLPEI